MGDTEIRASGPVLKILKLMLENPAKKLSGADISGGAKIGSGTLYPALQRMERAAWLTSAWEDIDPSAAGRPRRRYYRLSALGQKKALELLGEFQFEGALAWSL